MDNCTNAYNLTDCLLLSILDAVQEPNVWDAPTFSLTVVIGIVALIFAAMTVIQGLAGPGRRRCSRNAIGNWSQKTKYRLNYSQFRRESVAHTPLLTAGKILQKQEEEEGEKGIKTITKKLSELVPISHPAHGEVNRYDKNNCEDQYRPATWLHLLIHNGMNQFVWEDFAMETRLTPADYLPSEIQAVPAYMDIDTIVVLAAAAGCDTLTMEPDSDLPRLTGANAQIRFRREPFLGVVASFEFYERSAQSMRSSKSRIDRFMSPFAKSELTPPEQSQGWLHWFASTLRKSHGGFQTKESDQTTESNQVNVLESGSETYTIRASKGPGFGPCITGPALNIDFGKECSHEAPDGGRALCQCWTLLVDLASRHNISWLLYAEKFDPGEVFPARSANVKKILGSLVVQGSFWSRNHLPEKWVLSKLDIETADWKRFWSSSNFRDNFDKYKSWNVFALCLHFAVDSDAGKRSFLRLPFSQRFRFRNAITQEIEEVDKALKDFKHSVRCTQVELYMISAALIRLEPYEDFLKELKGKATVHLPDTPIEPKIGMRDRKILRLLSSLQNEGGETLTQLYRLFLNLFDESWAVEIDVLRKSLSKLGPAESWEGLRSATGTYDNAQSPIEVMKAQKVPDRELLIYKAIMLATSCLTALDNSDIFERGIGRNVVPFL